ncbi:protein kinase domain-containing protein [Nocardiopsis ganjiahuensis]|uniref:protein kinase domain-containing protein n=1 Tax=Nocardiopsis ganjiahuensis TaxID=239984 RepID=UPI00034CE150|nr:protein kinase [Nocardiopsis ganjiahuensis]
MSGEEQQSRLAPGFHSTEVLYRGSASTVYRARRDGDDTPVALKVMRDDAGTREADRLVELSGTPGLVTALGGGRTSSGRAFVAMELHPEGDYASALDDRGPLPLEEVLGVGRSVAGALAALHGRGLLHHRIEPGNILRGPDGAVLADVGGLLPAEERPEPVGLEPVAVAYASPEALSGAHPLTPASDVYRLAVVLWTLLAGHPPFAREAGTTGDPFAYRERVLAEDPPRLPRADLPAPLREVLDRALSKDPAERQDAAALAADLDRVAPGTVAVGPDPADTGAEGAAGTAPVVDEACADPETESAVPDGQTAPGEPALSTSVDTALAATDPAPSVPAPTDPAATGSAPGDPAPTDPAPTDPAATHPAPGDPAPTEAESTGSSAPPVPAEGRAAPTSVDRFLADRPELAWAALPGWAGTSTPEPPLAAQSPGADSDPAPEPSEPEQGSPGYHWAQTPSGPPAPPEPPKPPETAPRPHGPGPRRPLFIGVTVAAIAFVAVTLGAVAVLRPGAGGDLLEQVRQDTPASPEASDDSGGSGTDASQNGQSDGPAPPADLIEASAPTDLALEDSGHTVLVSWTDNTDPAAAHQVVGGPEGETPGNLADADPGAAQAGVSGLEPGREYCFIVIAVLSVDEIAPSEQVCTNRTGAA